MTVGLLAHSTKWTSEADDSHRLMAMASHAGGGCSVTRSMIASCAQLLCWLAGGARWCSDTTMWARILPSLFMIRFSCVHCRAGGTLVCRCRGVRVGVQTRQCGQGLRLRSSWTGAVCWYSSFATLGSTVDACSTSCMKVEPRILKSISSCSPASWCGKECTVDASVTLPVWLHVEIRTLFA